MEIILEIILQNIHQYADRWKYNCELKYLL